MRPHNLPFRRQASQRGFSLVELFYALGYFAFGLEALVLFQIVGSYGSVRAGDISMATNLVSNRIEELRLVRPTDVIDAGASIKYFDHTGATLTGSSGYFTVTATPTQPVGARYYDLKANVTWKQSINDTLVHNIDMYTRIPTE